MTISRALANLDSTTGTVHLPAVQDIPVSDENVVDMYYQACCDRCGWVSPSLMFAWRDAADIALNHSRPLNPAVDETNPSTWRYTHYK